MSQIQTIAKNLGKALLCLSKIPNAPQSGFSDSCAKMLTALEREKIKFSEEIFAVNTLRNFNEPMHRLCEIVCEMEEFLSSFAIMAARTAKRVDAGEIQKSEYERLIESAKIRLYDLGMEAERIGKEFQDV